MIGPEYFLAVVAAATVLSFAGMLAYQHLVDAWVLRRRRRRIPRRGKR